ncbi:MAG: HAD-IIA family hydrolase [Alistipes sp.]|nr:HAD-IIA family hydrolase [Alistipes sp.]
MQHDKYSSVYSDEELFARLRGIRHVALDMDGTIYMGMSLFDYTKPFLARLKQMGITYSFLTNNPSTSIADYLKKLAGMGIEATADEMYTTALATIDYLKTHLPAAKRLFILGTQSMTSEFVKAGFEVAEDSADDRPDAVVVAFDKTLSYARLCRAAWWIQQGLPYVATNPDRVCPTDEPTVLVDCGSICKCLEHATSRQPDITLGKPDPNMLSGIMQRYGLRADEIAMVGDRIYTDVQMAFNAGAFGVLVLSGETTLDIVAEAPRKPDLTADNIAVLGDLLENSKLHSLCSVGSKL